MKKFLMSLVFLSLLILPLSAVEKSPPHNGYFWAENDHLGDVALWFKLGYLNGSAHTQLRLADELYSLSLLAPSGNSNRILLTTILESWSSYYYISGVSFGQTIDGLNEFYKDWKNKQVDILDALYIIKLELEGTSSAEIDKSKRLLRLPQEKIWQMLLSDTVSQADKNLLLRNALKRK